MTKTRERVPSIDDTRNSAFRSSPEQLRAYSLVRPHLLPGALEYYDRLTPAEQMWFEASMNRIERMQSLRDKGFPIPDGFVETNLVHVIESLDIASAYSRENPNLGELIDFSQVQIYTLVHDIGEMAEKIGDVQPTKRTHRDDARKRLEPIAAKSVIIPQISDPEFRAQVLADYTEYTRNKKEDESINLEYEMARFIDQAQGTSRAAPIAFNVNAIRGKIKDKEVIRSRMTGHLMETVWKMIDPALNLMEHLPYQKARGEMRKILGGEIQYLKDYGPPKVAETLEGYIANE